MKGKPPNLKEAVIKILLVKGIISDIPPMGL